MFQINSDGSVGGQFTNGNPVLNQKATVLDAAWLNALQQELIYLIEYTQQTPSTNTTQILQAILFLIHNSGLQPGGNYQPAGNYVTEPELAAYETIADLNLRPFATQNFQIFGVSNAFTVPNHINRITVQVVGCGGAGGSGVNQQYSGGGGGAGGYAVGSFPVTPGQQIPFTIGAPGFKQAGGVTGGTGGGVTFNGVSAFGGNGGGANAPDVQGGIGGLATVDSSILGYTMQGGDGSDGQGTQATTALSGQVLFAGNGGASFFGGGGRGGAGAGLYGKSPGSGGGGCYLQTGSGGNGASGLVIVNY